MCVYTLLDHITHKHKIQSATYIHEAAALTAGTAGTRLLGTLVGMN